MVSHRFQHWHLAGSVCSLMLKMLKRWVIGHAIKRIRQVHIAVSEVGRTIFSNILFDLHMFVHNVEETEMVWLSTRGKKE